MIALKIKNTISAIYTSNHLLLLHLSTLLLICYSSSHANSIEILKSKINEALNVFMPHDWLPVVDATLQHLQAVAPSDVTNRSDKKL